MAEQLFSYKGRMMTIKQYKTLEAQDKEEAEEKEKAKLIAEEKAKPFCEYCDAKGSIHMNNCTRPQTLTNILE